MAGQRSTIFLLLGMVAWIAIGIAGALIAAAIVGIGAGVLHGAGAFALPNNLTFVLVAASGFQGTMLLGALRQGRRAGNGDWRAGLGFTPLRHKGVVVLLSAAMLGWLTVFILLTAAFPALREFVKSVTPDVLFGSGDDGVVVILLRVVLIAILAPVSEELFFRGWLWEALRRRGHTPLVTACTTAIPWLLLHGIEQPWRILLLIPAALIFSIARYLGGSVRASLAVHMTNNTAAVVMQTVSTLFGHEI